MTRLVYIGGYGRSGSTLLERLLARNANIVACGEVVRHAHPTYFKRKRMCTCGLSASDCPVWSSFESDPASHVPLTMALLSHVSPRYAAMVDSSKTTWLSMMAPFRLYRRLRHDFLLIHLVRDPRGVAFSSLNPDGVRKRSRPRRPLGLCIRTMFGWWAANLSCELFGKLHPRHYVRLRYEELVRAHAVELERLTDAAQIPRAPAPSDESNRHQLFGNAMRFAEITTIEDDQRWRGEMPTRIVRAVEVLSWPLRKRYGYARQPAHASKPSSAT
jgi:hypothetical protein